MKKQRQELFDRWRSPTGNLIRKEIAVLLEKGEAPTEILKTFPFAEEVKDFKDLRALDFSEMPALLEGKRFIGYAFDFSSFIAETLMGSEFENCSFQFADLSGAYLHRAKFKTCAFHQAKLGAYMDWTVFEASDLKGASFDEASGRGVDFSGSDLEGCRFQDTALRAARFRNTSLKQALFLRTDLRGAKFNGANLVGTVFSHCWLDHVDFSQALCDAVPQIEGTMTCAPKGALSQVLLELEAWPNQEQRAIAQQRIKDLMNRSKSSDAAKGSPLPKELAERLASMIEEVFERG